MKRLLSLSLALVAVLILGFWWQDRSESRPGTFSATTESSKAGLPTSFSAPSTLPATAASVAASAQPQAPGAGVRNAMTLPSVNRNSSSGPLSSILPATNIPAPTVWDRLENPEILETAILTQADGSVRRARLVKTAGLSKYPLVIFEGTLPAGNTRAPDTALQNAKAKVASHLIARPANGLSETDFAKALTASGLTLGDRLGPDGPYLVEVPQAGLSSVDEAISSLQRSGSAAYAEPDYLVHASDIPATDVQVDLVNGVATYPQMALDERTAPLPMVPTFDVDIQEAALKERLLDLPAQTRIITFDPPNFMGGLGSYRPYLEEQSFVIGSDNGVFVQNAYNSGYPNNGTFYARSTSSEKNFTIRHREGISFSILSVDLSEYSDLFAYPVTIGFTGYKADGSTVFQSFRTDGIFDGTGPLQDFQTFTFNSSFNNLTKVVASTTGVYDR